MFDARMRVDSIRLFVFMDTVSRHALISLKMANEEDVLLDLSENVIEVKSTPKRKGNKVRTRSCDGFWRPASTIQETTEYTVQLIVIWSGFVDYSGIY